MTAHAEHIGMRPSAVSHAGDGSRPHDRHAVSFSSRCSLTVPNLACASRSIVDGIRGPALPEPYDGLMSATPDEFERMAVDAVADAVPDADVDALRASFDLIRASTRLVQRLEWEVHREAGWSMAGFRVMFCVWVRGELEPRDIARLSGLSRAAVSSVLNTLERDGLVERFRESDDRRLVTVRLTPDGAQRLVAAYRRQNVVEQEFFGSLDDGERRRLADDLGRLLSDRRRPLG
jgi:DNA-binding MarR family transcriptional regulator